MERKILDILAEMERTLTEVNTIAGLNSDIQEAYFNSKASLPALNRMAFLNDHLSEAAEKLSGQIRAAHTVIFESRKEGASA